MRRRGWVLLIASGLIPVLGLVHTPPDPMLLIYSVFVLACLFRRRLAGWSDRLSWPPAVSLLIFFWFSGCLTETLAWLNNYANTAPEPALFHPQLIPDLILGLGFYGGWAVAWWLGFRWFRFNLAETFLITGIQGIFFEQFGAVFVRMVRLLPTNPLLSLLMGLYVFAVHGSAVGLAMVPVVHRLGERSRSRNPIRLLIVCLLMVVLSIVGAQLVSLIALGFGGLPPKRSIVEHPLW
ncbi:MAG: hypothetical protein ACHRXM_09175 [Isosphaerales bacterium]